MWDEVRRLHAHHSEVPVEVRLLKLTEEVGEVADAYIGVHGFNKRKGTYRTPDDLLDELADVIITAAVAMSAVADGTNQARKTLRTSRRHSDNTGGTAPKRQLTSPDCPGSQNLQKLKSRISRLAKASPA